MSRPASGEVVSRAQKEKSNPQADVLVTLPRSFKRRRPWDCSRTAASTDSYPAAAKDPKGQWISLVNNYLDFIDNSKPARSRAHGRPHQPPAQGQLQYSTPGQGR